MNQAFTTWIFRANVFFFALLIPILFEFSPSDESRIFRLSTSVLLLIIIFILPAINATALFSKIFKLTLDAVELFAISIALSLLFVPLILCIEADVLNVLSRELPLINTFFSFILFLLFFRKVEDSHQNTPLFTTTGTTYSYWKALLLSFIVMALAIVGIITAYYPLPDLDPYYWVAVFQDQFAKGIISSLSSHRPLFSSLTYLFNQSADVDLYAFFKYLIPFFALTPLIPAILIARRFSGFISQLVIFLTPLVNASFFLYTTLPIPQSIFNSLLITAIFFTLHALLTQKKIYTYITGIILLFGFFFHEIAVIPFIAWLIALLITERATFLQFAKKNRLATGLILILILSNFSLLSPLFAFATAWSIKVITLIVHSQTNFLFPSQYTNIDGNSVGWQGLWGIIRYYTYYFGPAAFLIIISIPFILQNARIRVLLKKQEILFLFFSFSLFFFMSDILPRLFNIALLPERALGFVSLFLLACIPLLFIALHTTTHSYWHRFIPSLFLIALFINLAGALYINSLKTYLITPAQIKSAEWIRMNLPKNHIIFSSDHHRLLTFYAHANVSEIADFQFYFDTNIFEKYFSNHTPKNIVRPNMTRTQLNKVSNSLADLANKQTPFDKNFILSLKNESTELEKISISIEEEIALMNADKTISAKQYIYFSAPSDKNPYVHRPYMKTLEQKGGLFIFDQYPERFRIIYSDTENNIYLWEIL